jgi:putative transposase
MKDSLWSVDLFRCESVALQTYWVLVVMDQFTRRIIGFAVCRGAVDGLALCRMFNRAIRGQTVPKYVSSDHDALYRFHQWQANLRVLEITEIKTVPYVPLSHPFVERMIGNVDESISIEYFSGPEPISRRSLSDSNITTMRIGRMRRWPEARRNRSATQAAQL